MADEGLLLDIPEHFFLSNGFSVSLLNKERTGSNKSGITYFLLYLIGMSE